MNPNYNPKSWTFLAWEEGYHSLDDDENPYRQDYEVLATQWDMGREAAVYDRFCEKEILRALA